MPKLREALLDAQYDLFHDGRFPVMVLIAGVDGAGKGETVNLLNEWMDPRHIRVAAFGEPSDEERERPPVWRYWRELPPKRQALRPHQGAEDPLRAPRIGARTLMPRELAAIAVLTGLPPSLPVAYT